MAASKSKASAKNQMTLETFDAFCGTLPHANRVIQWGQSHVWKVATKLFAVGSLHPADNALHVTFKCSPMAYEMLKDGPGLRPAPYLASRGMLWIQRTSPASMSDAELKDFLTESHRLASLNLPKKIQKQLGLN
jgi:predicted DNA-binding protein (MmcQ/YjbR family)